MSQRVPLYSMTTSANTTPGRAGANRGATSLGYFAFPPTTEIQAPCTYQDTPSTNDDSDRSPEDDKEEKGRAQAWEEQKKLAEEARQRRLQQESELARQGEFDWVRSGGILRDAQGRRDQVRTESIRAEIRLQKEEKILMDRWENYESRWRALVSSTGPVRFVDIPWPVPTPPSTVADLSAARISEFLLGPLRVRANTTTRKERIRASLLRWHPDKARSVLDRVVEEDVGAVREGVSTVMMCLKGLQGAQAS